MHPSVIAEIHSFVRRVNEAAERAIEAGKPREGAHFRAMKWELDKLPAYVSRGGDRGPTIAGSLANMELHGVRVARAMTGETKESPDAVIGFALGKAPSAELLAFIDDLANRYPVNSDTTQPNADTIEKPAEDEDDSMPDPIMTPEGWSRLLEAINKTNVTTAQPAGKKLSLQSRVGRAFMQAFDCPHPIWRKIARNAVTGETEIAIIIARGHDVCEALIDASETVGQEVPPDLRSTGIEIGNAINSSPRAVFASMEDMNVDEYLQKEPGRLILYVRGENVPLWENIIREAMREDAEDIELITPEP